MCLWALHGHRARSKNRTRRRKIAIPAQCETASTQSSATELRKCQLDTLSRFQHCVQCTRFNMSDPGKWQEKHQIEQKGHCFSVLKLEMHRVSLHQNNCIEHNYQSAINIYFFPKLYAFNSRKIKVNLNIF